MKVKNILLSVLFITSGHTIASSQTNPGDAQTVGDVDREIYQVNIDAHDRINEIKNNQSTVDANQNDNITHAINTANTAMAIATTAAGDKGDKGDKEIRR